MHTYLNYIKDAHIPKLHYYHGNASPQNTDNTVFLYYQKSDMFLLKKDLNATYWSVITIKSDLIYTKNDLLYRSREYPAGAFCCKTRGGVSVRVLKNIVLYTYIRFTQFENQNIQPLWNTVIGTELILESGVPGLQGSSLK